MRQIQLQPTLKWFILIDYGRWFGWRFIAPRYSTYGPDRKGEFSLTFGFPFCKVDIHFDPIIPTRGWDGRYDLMYNLFTGEYTESICRCEPGTCTFTDAYMKAGEPTHVDGKDSWAVALERVLRKIFPSRKR